MSKHTHIRLDLLRDSFPDRPEMGPALSRRLMDEVAAGERPATCRLTRPGRVVAFGRRDTVSPRYADAVEVASGLGFPGMERIAGGRAALCSEGVISFTIATPEDQVARGTGSRFDAVAKMIADSLSDIGVDSRIGEVPGEYCPGSHTVNAGGRIKLAGIAQRLIKGCAHVGVVLVVRDSALVREVLVPVYGALGLEWDPASSGAVEDEVPGVGLEDVESAILRRLGLEYEVQPVALAAETLAAAEAAAGRFRSPRP